MERFDATPAVVVQSGSGVAVPATAAGVSSTVAVTFPAAYPTPPRFVDVMPRDARLTPGVTTITATGFSVTFGNWSPADAVAGTFSWQATP